MSYSNEIFLKAHLQNLSSTKVESDFPCREEVSSLYPDELLQTKPLPGLEASRFIMPHNHNNQHF
jgi:hypothetical protein